MDRQLLIKRLMATFLGELDEHVRALNRDLLALEEGRGGPEAYASLLRAVHSLKGAARSVGVAPIESASHLLEEVFVAGRDGRLEPGGDLFALLFAAADAIEESGIRLREDAGLADSPLVALLPRLEAAAARALPEPSTRPDPAPEPEPEPEPEPAPMPTASAEAPAGPTPASSAEAATVRVAAEKLDALLTHSGELLVARRRVGSRGDDLATIREAVRRWRSDWRAVEKPLAELLDGPASGDRRAISGRAASTLRKAGEGLARLERDLDRLSQAMAGDRALLDRAAGNLEEEVRRARMLPFAEACQGLRRVARDVAQAAGKQVELVVGGGDVEVDRSVLEALKGPLRHLVQNAVDHGIEPPGARVEAGKPPLGRVTVSATLRGSQVEVVVEDDGGGIDPARLREQARRLGLEPPEDDGEARRLIFRPGFSTAGRLTHVSGRGVGLDVVRDRLERLHGTIDVASEPGRGARFVLAVPLTLTTLRALLVSAGGQVFALATTNVRKLARVGPEDFRVVEGCRVLSAGQGPLIPAASLAEALRLPTMDYPGKAPAVIVSAGDRRMALVVDELIAEQEITVKGLGPRVRHARLFSGATILPSGRIALVLNAAGVIRSALARGGAATASAKALDAAPARGRPASGPGRKRRLLVVDDSVTTRTLERSILELAGYHVETAVDGEDGWRKVQEWGPDLVISDVEMPRMDGFAVTRAIRSSPRFAGLPVILFSSRGSEADRARGIEVGADAYIVKGAFDQKTLLETVAQLL